MSEHFHDDNFIEAAKVYQSIKAPSDLRERVLADTASVPKRAAGRVKSEARGKIYKLASVAACLAIMAAAVPGFLSEETGGMLPAEPQMASIDTPSPMRMVAPPEDEGFAGEEETIVENEIELESISITAADLAQMLDLEESDLAQSEIRLVLEADGSCTAEIVWVDHALQAVLVKNEASGQWEMKENE